MVLLLFEIRFDSGGGSEKKSRKISIYSLSLERKIFGINSTIQAKVDVFVQPGPICSVQFGSKAFIEPVLRATPRNVLHTGNRKMIP